MLAQGHVLNNRYRIVKQIGQGGFGSVYRAWDITLNRACAIKENTDFTESTQRQFEREAQVLGGLSHPNLVKVLDLINIPGQAQYLVMEYIDGEDLDSLLQREQRVDPARALVWIYKVCEALTYLHEQNPPIVHRDIKPANIRLTPKGEVVLVDFGLVKVYAGGRKTTVGARAVTPGYSPPEQYGYGSTDARTDVYALAATLYTLLTGDPPEESVQRLGNPALRSIRTFHPQVSQQLDLLLAKGLDINVANRYQTIKAFQQALERVVRPVVQPPAYSRASVGTNRYSASPAAPPRPAVLRSVRKSSPKGISDAGVVFGITVLMIIFNLLQNLAAPTPVYSPAEIPVPELPVLANTPWSQSNQLTTPDNAAEVTQLALGQIQIRWFVGLGTGTNPDQIAVQEEVVADFNAAHPDIQLVLEVVPYDAARDTLATQIASSAGPDIIGPVGWGGSNAFYGQWLDLSPYIEATDFDTSVFDPALVVFYQTEEGQVGLPFAVFPAATYFVPDMFDEVGLAYPPQTYGEQYELDGEMVDWDLDTFTEVAKRLTIDTNGYNATEAEFDPTQIVQVGFSPQWQTHTNYIGSYFAGGSSIFTGEAKGEYKAQFPDSWKEANQWFYEGMYGEEPWMATGPLAASSEFGGGNLFNSGKGAMAITPIWYTCCLGDFKNAGFEFQAGILPIGLNGEPNGRVDADTFRVWKGTKNPEAAFTVLSYLLTDGADKLLPIYGAMPAIVEKMDFFFEQKSNDFPFVSDESWDVFVTNLAYPDIPSAEQFQPNWNEAWARQQTFVDLMQNTPPDQFNFETEWQKMIDDLNLIYNRRY